ncbi:hypothetical protein HMPREF3226_00353, partial [Prevotella corporis]
MIHGFVYFWRSNLIGNVVYRSFLFQPLVAVGEDTVAIGEGGRC